MDALSPRDANINVKYKQEAKLVKPQPAKAAPAKTLQREKDHPPPPPAAVYEPSSSDRKNGAIYTTGRLLGKGGFAICHEGVLQGTGAKYALKIVKSQMSQKKMEQKFQTELQIHSKMRHANIVQFHRAFTFQASTYLVLELCTNGSLMDMVKKRKFLSEPEVRFYTVQIAGAIKYMHAKGIIHRDLKMGNIFLDENMNVKIGDFGLAAMLVSGKDMTTIRRTTLCGTPNYIAPEILEKSKKGHDHAVDIWSLGIIIFAMLTGRPPFQSTTQDEIYRKAREREYDWPKMDNSANYISPEAKELVAWLLQNPEDRPAPDTIVQHPFFTCGRVPQPKEITPKLKDSAPDAKFASLGRTSGRASAYIKAHEQLCMLSEVGPYSDPAKKYSSTYREVLAEEKAGLTPAVPLPDNVVYRPFEEYLREHAQILPREDSSEGSVSEASFETTLGSTLPVRALSTVSQRAPQSFAAQQRSQNQPSAILPQRTIKTRTQIEEKRVQEPVIVELAPRVAAPATGIPSRRVRSNPIVAAAPERDIDVQVRLGTEMAKQLKRTDSGPLQVIEAKVEEGTDFSLFSPRERTEAFPATRPDRVLKSVQKLHAELERALNSRSQAAARATPPSDPIIVVKWVDYTNKFGLGYILSTGAVGCIFIKAPTMQGSPGGYTLPSALLVRDGDRHLNNRSNPNYLDRHQLVPITGAKKIEFYENKGEEGISRVLVNPKEYKVTVGADGKPDSLTRGRDDFDNRKRQKMMLWKKFANYMTAFGRDQEYNDASFKKHPAADDTSGGDVVTFYQRFGDVGCWGFCDGHFQFNFPDHTKLLLSADGTWCDLYALPMEAARELREKSTISSKALDEREHLSFPVQTLLNFVSKPSTTRSRSAAASRRPVIDPMTQGIPEANDFREKIEFIKQIMGEWIANGGIGRSDMSVEGRLRWMGLREVVNVKSPYKHVWATVGARGGDERRVAWFDPRKPQEMVPDME